MTKYEVIFVHSAGAIGSEPTVHGARRADAAIKDYQSGNVERIVCLGTPEVIYRTYILRKSNIPSSKVEWLPGKSSFQQVFNTRDYLNEKQIYRGIAVSSQSWHLRPRLSYLYSNTIPLGIDYKVAEDPREPGVIQKEIVREKIALWMDKRKMWLPEEISRRDFWETAPSYPERVARSMGIFWKP